MEKKGKLGDSQGVRICQETMKGHQGPITRHKVGKTGSTQRYNKCGKGKISQQAY